MDRSTGQEVIGSGPSPWPHCYIQTLPEDREPPTADHLLNLPDYAGRRAGSQDVEDDPTSVGGPWSITATDSALSGALTSPLTMSSTRLIVMRTG